MSSLRQALSSSSAQHPVAVVVDFEKKQSLFDHWPELKSILAQAKHLKLYVVQAPTQLRAELARESTLQMLWKDSFDDVLKELDGKALFAPLTFSDKEMEKVLVESFTLGAIKTFEIQCSVETKAKPSYPKTKDNRVVYDIAASMGLMGKFVSGAVALGFPEKVFLGIMTNMLGEKYDTLTEEVEDGCGEILNIIFGQAKKELNQKGFLFGKTLPTIFVGSSLRVRQLAPNPAVILPFETEFGPFYIELGYRKTS